MMTWHKPANQIDLSLIFFSVLWPLLTTYCSAHSWLPRRTTLELTRNVGITHSMAQSTECSEISMTTYSNVCNPAENLTDNPTDNPVNNLGDLLMIY